MSTERSADQKRRLQYSQLSRGAISSTSTVTWWCRLPSQQMERWRAGIGTDGGDLLLPLKPQIQRSYSQAPTLSKDLIRRHTIRPEILYPPVSYCPSVRPISFSFSSVADLTGPTFCSKYTSLLLFSFSCCMYSHKCGQRDLTQHQVKRWTSYQKKKNYGSLSTRGW